MRLPMCCGRDQTGLAIDASHLLEISQYLGNMEWSAEAWARFDKKFPAAGTSAEKSADSSADKCRDRVTTDRHFSGLPLGAQKVPTGAVGSDSSGVSN